jgi:hypothetical protein
MLGFTCLGIKQGLVQGCGFRWNSNFSTELTWSALISVYRE